MKSQTLPTPKEVLKKYPLSKEDKIFIKNSRNMAKKIFLQKTNKKIFIIGPCSFFSKKSILKYAENFKKFFIHENIFLVLRCFYEKSRSKTGWKGFLYSQNTKKPSIKKGILETRKTMIKLTKNKIPICAEILEPLTINYFKDIITWAVIGSRTNTSQIHRQLASGLDFPVGFKNSLDDNENTSINGVISAKNPHNFLNISNDGKIKSFKSHGNFYSHIILRGSYKTTNYEKKDIQRYLKKIKKENIYCPIIIDCSHGNAQKNIFLQKKCFKKSIFHLIEKKEIIGIMLESFLKEGVQKTEKDKNFILGKSITDPCIGIKETEKLITFANHLFCQHL